MTLPSPHRPAAKPRKREMRIVGGEFRGRPIVAPPGYHTRPTAGRIRESLFNIVASAAPPQGARVADLFAGAGALGLEAASRGAAFVLFVENEPAACKIIRANIARFGLAARADLRCGDAASPGNIAGMEPFDLALADPPYAKGLGEMAAQALAAGGWLKPDALFVLEEDAASRLRPIPSFEAVDERRYGRTRLHFLRYRPAPAFSADDQSLT